MFWICLFQYKWNLCHSLFSNNLFATGKQEQPQNLATHTLTSFDKDPGRAVAICRSKFVSGIVFVGN